MDAMNADRAERSASARQAHRRHRRSLRFRISARRAVRRENERSTPCPAGRPRRAASRSRLRRRRIAGLAAEGDGLGAVEAVGAAGAGAAGAAGGGAGARALPAVEAAAAVGHGGLPAGAAADARLRPAARRLHIVAGRVAVPEPAAVGVSIGQSRGSRRLVGLGHGFPCGLNCFEQNMNIATGRLVVKGRAGSEDLARGGAETRRILLFLRVSASPREFKPSTGRGGRTGNGKWNDRY